MPKWIRTQANGWGRVAPWLLSLAVVVLTLLLPVQAQGTLDPCSVRANYDQAKASADAADQAFQTLKEPDWSQLPMGYDKKYNLPGQVQGRDKRVETLLKQLKADLQQRMVFGNLTSQQAQADLTAAQAKEKALKVAIERLKQEIGALDKDPSMPDAESRKWMETIATSEARIIELVGDPNIAVARWRPGDPQFNDFKSPEITQKRLALDRAKSDEAKQAAELALNQAIEQTRQGALNAVAALDQATDELAKLGWVSEEGEKLVRQKSQKQREIVRTEAELKTAYTKVQDARLRLATVKGVANFEAAIGSVEPWSNALRKRDEADKKFEQAKLDYGNAIEAKNKLLENAKARFNDEQARIARTQTNLKGQAKDQAYYQKLSQMTLHARATYELILLSLADLDCFGDVRYFMDEIKARMKKLDEARDQILKQASAAAKAAAAKPVAVRGTFGLTQVVVGKVPGTGETNNNRFYGSVSATSFSFTNEAKLPYVGKANVSHTWNTPPSTLKPGDIIELGCSSTASKSGPDAPNLGSNCKWDVEGKVQYLEDPTSSFAGTNSEGKFYPQGKGKSRFRILPPDGTYNTITITATHSGPWWYDASKELPAIYKYKFNP